MHHSTVIFCLRAIFAALIAGGWTFQIVFIQVIVVGLLFFMAWFAGRILYGAHLAGSMGGFANLILSQEIRPRDNDAEDKQWFLAMSTTAKLQAVFLTYDVPVALFLTYFGSGGWGALYLGSAAVIHVLLKTVRGQIEVSY